MPFTPTVVIAPGAPVAEVSRRVYQQGNLELSIACADEPATPAGGLTVTADGLPQIARRVDDLWSAEASTSYLLAPGRHHIQISVPGCAPSAFDVDAFPDQVQHASGRLAVSDWSLAGPVGAPNGFGTAFGAWLARGPSGTSTNYFGQTATFDGAHGGEGGFVSFSHERRNLVMAWDLGFATAPISGTEAGPSVFGSEAPQSFTGTAYMSTAQYRVGARVPLEELSLAAGTGIGLDWWIQSTALTGSQTTGLFAPDGVDATFYFPMWATATIKPTCNWGAQVMGQYDVHPTAMTTNGVEIMAGLIYQPSDACSESAGVAVTVD